MKQGREVTERELLNEGWIPLYVFKGGYEVWEKNESYILFDPKEEIVLATYSLQL